MLRISRYRGRRRRGRLTLFVHQGGTERRHALFAYRGRKRRHSHAQPASLHGRRPIGYISQMTQAYLVKYDAQNQPYPELLTSVPTQANGGISKDGNTITWHLRKGVRWSDGAPFNGRRRRLLHASRPQPGEQRGRARRLEPHHEDRRARQVYRRLSSRAPVPPHTSRRFSAVPVRIRRCCPKHLLGSLSEHQSRSRIIQTRWNRAVSHRGLAARRQASIGGRIRTISAACRSSSAYTYKFIPSRDTLVTLHADRRRGAVAAGARILHHAGSSAFPTSRPTSSLRRVLSSRL